MKTDFLIIGAGIVGLSIARALQQRHPGRRIDIIEKETDVARHASGRNSGVLHAGFYYTEDSLKAKFTREGNLRLKEFCREYGLPINPCGKVVVAQNEDEIGTLHELERRGKANGVNVSIIDESSVREIDPNIRTCRYALHSPETATVDPRAVVRKLRDIIVAEGGRLHLDTSYLYQLGRGHVRTTRGSFDAGTVINCAGLYADKIAGSFGFGEKYTIIPFKGIYLKYSGDIPPVRTNVYPVPISGIPFSVFTIQLRWTERSKSVPRLFRLSGEKTTKAGNALIRMIWPKYCGMKPDCSWKTVSTSENWHTKSSANIHAAIWPSWPEEWS